MSLVNPDERPETPSPLPPRPASPALAPAVAAAEAGSRAESLNLARRPFGNSRPVVRVALLLWLLGLALLLGNVSLFWSYLSSSADKRAQVAQGDEEITKEQQTVGELQSRLNSYDLVQLNDKIDFLNTQIDARTFSWSLLLDRLAEVMPNDLRLNRLVPLTAAKSERQSQRDRSVRRSPAREGEVQLTISGEARNDEAPLRFVDNLFAHPAFRDPNLLRESRGDEGSNVLKFDLTVTYLPGGLPHGVVVEESPAGTPGTAATKPQVTPGKPAPTATPSPGGRP
jgi:type IV pilus assembly PilN-like protein